MERKWEALPDARDWEIQRLEERVTSAADGLRERDAEIGRLNAWREQAKTWEREATLLRADLGRHQEDTEQQIEAMVRDKDAEIERLEGEINILCRHKHELLGDLDEQSAEIERLEHTLEDCKKYYELTLQERHQLREALRKITELDADMGIYPAAVRGFHDERDYEQRDGYKNGWNAACMEFTQKAAEIANAVLAPKETKP